MKLDGLRFEDSSIINLEFHEMNLILALEDVQEADVNQTIEQAEKQFSGKLTFSGISNLIVNQYPAESIKMLFSEGGIKHFELTDKFAKIFVNWCDYDTNKEKPIFYEFNFEQVTWKSLSEYQAI